jgi:hypothetical protein
MVVYRPKRSSVRYRKLEDANVGREWLVCYLPDEQDPFSR